MADIGEKTRQLTPPRKLVSVILFADVAGSTRLYEQLGDDEAQRAIAVSLHSATEIVADFGGTVVKTIGDEIMARFSSAEDAVEAACRMQHENTGPDAPLLPENALRIGIHRGEVVMTRNDVFGDAVNVAARVTSIATAGKIIATRDVVVMLPPQMTPKARVYDRIVLRGKENEVTIYEILWRDLRFFTRISGVQDDALTTAQKKTLRLTTQTQKLYMKGGTEVILLGRNQQCDLIFDAPCVSRHHARIYYQHGKFVLRDHSTNGTFVQSPSSEPVYLKREECPLLGTGEILLGASRSPDGSFMVHFTST